MTKSQYKLSLHKSFFDFKPEEWNPLVPEDSVFQEWEFLSTLEKTSCLGLTGDWEIQIFAVKENENLSGLFPFYKRLDSYGEYIFDFQWANAFHKAGIPYYPKFTASVPFTPVTGARILLQPNLSDVEKDSIAKLLLESYIELGREEGVSSSHILFCKDDELNWGKAVGMVPRLTHQYHWINKGYESFEDYLNSLVKDRRKTIRQERKKINALGLKIETLVGGAVKEEHADIFYNFYMDTHSRKWGQAYLNRNFFLLIFKTMAHRIHLVLASDNSGKPIGGSFNFFRGDYLFGRYWGALEHIPNLHFECCYYRLIDFAIEHKMKRVEAGAQGEHKFLRGYEAVPMHSLHYIYNESGSVAIYNYLEREIKLEEENISSYNAHSPLKALRKV
ncbi:MAG: GNAT family N-acetyltransferase [Leptospira sp.]|nr:GNAT family N-acetyltransferase [Leptospira sp.]